MHDCHDCDLEREMLEINTPDMEEVSRTLGKRLSNGIHIKERSDKVTNIVIKTP